MTPSLARAAIERAIRLARSASDNRRQADRQPGTKTARDRDARADAQDAEADVLIASVMEFLS